MSTTPEFVAVPETDADADFAAALRPALDTFADSILQLGRAYGIHPAELDLNYRVEVMGRNADLDGIVQARAAALEVTAAAVVHELLAVDAVTGYCTCGFTAPGPPSVTVDAVLAHLAEQPGPRG